MDREELIVRQVAAKIIGDNLPNERFENIEFAELKRLIDLWTDAIYGKQKNNSGENPGQQETV